MINFKYTGLLGNRRELVDRLVEEGLSRRAAEQKAEMFSVATTTLLTPNSSERNMDIRAFFVPGRIEVLGKHTDYAGGRSMVVAAERGFCLVLWPRKDNRITVIDAVSGETVGFKLDRDLVPRSGHWSNYPMTVARRIARNFPGARWGADIAFASDLPPAAGMSSSSALIVAVFFALADANDLWEHPAHGHVFEESTVLAGYLATVENGQSFGRLEGDRGVGTFGGSEDHTAILCAQRGQLSQYAYCPVELEQIIPVPLGHTFAIGVSGMVAEKTGAALTEYNTASQLASAVAELWRRETRRGDAHLAAALNSSPGAPTRLKEIIETARHTKFQSVTLARRLEHFMIESGEIIPAAGLALRQGDLRTFGRIVDKSQRAAERLLGNQIPQTSRLAATARKNGAVAASAFGAGFGGSVWAMVLAQDTDSFLAAWAADYRREFPQHAASSSFFVTAAGPAAFRIG